MEHSGNTPASIKSNSVVQPINEPRVSELANQCERPNGRFHRTHIHEAALRRLGEKGAPSLQDLINTAERFAPRRCRLDYLPMASLAYGRARTFGKTIGHPACGLVA